MQREKLNKLVITAMLMAIMLVLGFTSIGIIKIPPVNVTTLHIPVIIGTLVCGLGVGMVLGTFFGAISLYTAFTTPSVLVAPLMAASPVYVIIMSLGARLLIPVVTHFVHKAFRNKGFGIAVASIAGTLTNTICYLGLMLLFYVMAGLDSAAVLGVIAGAGALNGSGEAVAALLLCTPICLALSRYMKKSKPQTV